MKFLKSLIIIAILLFVFVPNFSQAASLRDVVISEVAYSGTRASSADEWIELKNNTAMDIDLIGWGVYEQGGDVLVVSLEGVISASSFYLLERTDGNTISDVEASQEPAPFSGSGLSNAGEHLVLKDGEGNVIDSVNASGGWFAGSASPDYFSMERTDLLTSGDEESNWHSNDSAIRSGQDAEGNLINGTPLRENSVVVLESVSEDSEDESGGEDDGLESQVASGDTGFPNIEDSSIDLGDDEKEVNINKSPIAVAGDDIFTFLGETVQFNALKSDDLDSSSLDFVWNLGNGQLIKEEVFGYEYQFPGRYVVTLVVSDGSNESYDEMIVNVMTGGIVVSEFMPNPLGNDTETEWIEVYNSSNFMVDLGGWQLDDVADGGSKAWQFPVKTFVSPGGYIVISREISGIALNNDSDAVRLIYPNGITADEIVYEKSQEGVSGIFMGGSFFWSGLATPGSTNILETKVVQNKGGAPMNSYFVENFSETYQNIVYSKEAEAENTNGNLVIIKGNITKGGVIEELEPLPGNGSNGVGRQGKFVPSKNMLQAAVGSSVSSQNVIFIVIISLFAGAGALYIFYVIKRKGTVKAETQSKDKKEEKQKDSKQQGKKGGRRKENWEIYIDE